MEFFLGWIVGMILGGLSVALISFGGFGAVKTHISESINALEKRIAGVVMLECAKVGEKIRQELKK